ncbi:MAG: hypothetical protein M3121_08660 [Chloroflexota bacterium]|nr:hypothetical protein [Chloroflexota bacterium]
MATVTQKDELLQQLIGTYRDLNNRVRPLTEERLRLKRGDHPSIRDVVVQMRDDELIFAQALKERLTGVPRPDVLENERPTLGSEQQGDPTAYVISQFGTARATTLSLVRELPEERWTEPIEGGGTVADRIQELVTSDQRQLERLNGLLGAP